MMRKLTVIFLSGLICLLGLTSVLAQETYELKDYEKLIGKKLTFQEAPELRIKVAAGELPPVEERLPEEPLVVKPVEEIGQYGGTWHRATRPADVWAFYSYGIKECLVRYSPDFTHIVPNLAKSWEISEDGKSITFYLRKGMKWSDGAPFTSDDFIFWWEDITLNDELTPVKPDLFIIGGELGKMEKIDDYTFKISFAKPYGMFLEKLADTRAGIQYAPKHYLKKFHPKYTSMDEIKKEMEKEGYDLWTDLFTAKNTKQENPQLPKIEAWLPIDGITGPMQRWVRNPYYWKIDTEGNQLPYIDKVQIELVSDIDTAVLKAIAGEVDFQWRCFYGCGNYSLAMQNREKGDYRVIPVMIPQSNLCCIFLNYHCKDPVLRKLFRDKRFRIALSIAINRKEISELLFMGFNEPSQVCPFKGTAWYDERVTKLYTEYNPERANRLLDEIGLKWDKNHEYRLRPDGERLRFVNNVNLGWPRENVEVQELIKGYWKKIGIETVVKPLAGKLWVARITAAEHEVASYAGGNCWPGHLPIDVSNFPISNYYYPAPLWGLWFATNGKSGEEPPTELKHVMELYEKAMSSISAEERNEALKEAFRILVEDLFIEIGIVTRPECELFIIAKNNLRNVPEGSLSENWGMYHPATFFKK